MICQEVSFLHHCALTVPLHPQLEICEGLEEAVQVRNCNGRQLLLILTISSLQKLFNAELIWRRMDSQIKVEEEGGCVEEEDGRA